MRISEGQKQQHILGNQRAYGDGYAALRWVSGPMALAAESERRQLLEQIALRGGIGAAGTKMDMNRLSPGCRVCVAGGWSCLFINGRCNGRCFYCPAPQDAVDDPTTNRIAFKSARDYAAYVAAFGFSGVSISGGEPLLTLGRTLDYIQAVKKRMGHSTHIWLYTNGTRVTRAVLQALRDAGLDEIRFDIGATRYHLKKAAMAAGIIPTVTIEIPAVPEELERLKMLTASMPSAGIAFLNLHQLRLTPHNFKHLSTRAYTFLHGDLVTVLESELTALKIVAHVLKQDLQLGVNYCSFVYKHRYQKAAARRRAAESICKPYESITENGYIRCFFLKGRPEDLNPVATQIGADPTVPETARHYDRKAGRLFLPPDIAEKFLCADLTPGVSYFESTLLSAITYSNPFKEIRLGKTKTIFVERVRRLPETDLPVRQSGDGGFVRELKNGSVTAPYESIADGLANYY